MKPVKVTEPGRMTAWYFRPRKSTFLYRSVGNVVQYAVHEGYAQLIVETVTHAVVSSCAVGILWEQPVWIHDELF
jgi:hypothetical protein